MKRKSIYNLVFYLSSVLFLGVLAQAKPTDFRVVGYLPDYRMHKIQASWAQGLTDIIYFSIKPTASGGLDTSQLKIDFLKQLRVFTQQNNQRLLICLGGWDKSAGFAPMAMDPVKRKKFIHRLAKFVQQYNLDGVDYDWEFPINAQEAKAYSDLIIETKNSLKKANRIVTVAVGATKRLCRSAYQAADYIHLMSYDHIQNHATYQKSMDDIKRQLDFGVPKEKLCLGVPFYGRGIHNRHQVKTYTQLAQLQLAPHIDQINGIYFNGVATIKKKTNWAIDNQLAGMMIWEIGQDSNQPQSLLQAIAQVVSNKKTKVITTTIVGIAAHPDPILMRVNELAKAGVLTDIRIMESFPVQIRLTGPISVIKELQQMKRKALELVQ